MKSHVYGSAWVLFECIVVKDLEGNNMTLTLFAILATISRVMAKHSGCWHPTIS